MLANIRILSEICEKERIPYRFLGKDRVGIAVEKKGESFLFIHQTVPANTASTQRVLKDKDLTYSILSPHVHVPKWRSILDPDIEERYQKYVKDRSIEEITKNIEKDFSYPVIVKPNAKSSGTNVAKCEEREDLRRALKDVFKKESTYDYLAIVQEYIEIEKEYRALYYKKDFQFVYLKDNSDATYQGNLSPLHFEGAVARDVKDKEILEKLDRFAQRSFDGMNIPYAGFDIAEDVNGVLWLIEINGSPWFDIYIRDCGEKKVRKMLGRILNDLGK